MYASQDLGIKHVSTTLACADPGIFSGGSRSDGQKTVWTMFFLVLNLFYSLQRGSNGFITEKTILLQGSRGGPTFSGGWVGGLGNFFQGGGVQIRVGVDYMQM